VFSVTGMQHVAVSTGISGIFLGQARDFSLEHSDQTGCGAHPAGVKRSGHDSHHPYPFRVKARMRGATRLSTHLTSV